MRARTARACSLLALLLSLAACGGGGGGGSANGGLPVGDFAHVDPNAYSTAPGASLAQPDEGAAVTQHEMQAQGATLHYTATAGHLTVRDGAGRPSASFFYVAYTLDGQDAAQRPVTFFYNGGPGSASVWLHLGSFGPKRLVTGNPSTTAPTPFPLVDNDETLLPTSDLVFVDAIGTGYSQAVAPYTNQQFWGVDADAAAFRDFVQAYAAANGRTASPKFLFGESYGTTRSAVLALLLETAGVHLKGVVLQSSVLDYNANCDQQSARVSCAGFLPTYAAVGAYHGRVSPPPADLGGFLQQMRGFTAQAYSPALDAYLRNGTPPAGSLLDALVADTGEPAAQWQIDLNLDPTTFRYTLLANTLLGRYDARMTAPQGSALARDGDPSSSFIDGPFAAAIASHLASGLRYGNTTVYPTLSNAIFSWNFSHDGRALPDTVPDLAAALALNPSLKVLSLNGLHDLATPFFQTETDLGRLGAGAPVQLKSYAGGHMTYLDDTARRQQLADLQAFYRQALLQP
jgi:carboxypeptidase C (cathepsin A)